MKRSSSPAAATISRLVEPTSVTTHSDPAAASASATSTGRAPTGAAQKTTSAPAQAWATESAIESMAPASTAPSRLSRRASKPATSASRRRRAASPIEPPIRPTPRTATLIGSRSDRAQFLAGHLGDVAELVRILGEALRGDRLGTVADRLLGLVVDLDDDPVGARGGGCERHR